MKLKSVLLLSVLSASAILLNGCGSKNIPDEVAGTYSVDRVNVTNRGEALGIKKSDLSVCRTVEVTKDGKIICKGLDDKKFELVYKSKDDDGISMYAKEAEEAGYDPKKARLAQDYTLDKDYEGPSTVYFYDDTLEVNFKFEGGTDAWYGVLNCSKSN